MGGHVRDTLATRRNPTLWMVGKDTSHAVIVPLIPHGTKVKQDRDWSNHDTEIVEHAVLLIP